MTIPIEFTILYTIISVVFLIITIELLFCNEITFNKTSAIMMYSFINAMISYFTAYTYFGINLYGYDLDGVLVENAFFTMSPVGMIYVFFAIVNVVFTLYCIYLFYMKPWKQLLKTYNRGRNPWYEDEESLNY